MSDLEAYYENFATQPSRWRAEDPCECGCKGTGYFLSELDTWHVCSIHYTEGQQHPEDETDPVEYAVSGLLRFFHRMQPVTFIVPVDDEDDIPF